MSSSVTGIELLSRTRTVYQDELSFASQGMKLDKADDAKNITNQILSTKTVKVLRVEGNTFSPAAAEELAKGIKEHPEIERFIGNDLFTSRLKNEIPLALGSICGAFQASGAKLVEINLSDNAFGPIGLDALVSFFQSATCFSLKEIRMHNNGLGPEGAKKFAGALENCYKNSNGKLQLKVFICGRNRLEIDGGRAISQALKTIGSLEEIQMPQNGIRPNGIEFVAEACAANKNLRILNLNDNTFTKRGGEAISKALIKLTNLEYVNFGDCLLRSAGSLLLVRSLVNNKNLKELILSFNEIDATNGVEIAQFLLNSMNGFNKMTLVDLNGNKFGEEVKVDIENMFTKRPGVLGLLDEDEGEDDEDIDDEEDEEDEETGEEEEEEEGAEYDGEEEGEDEYEDYEDGEDEDDYDEEEEEEGIAEKYGNLNINQNNERENLFANLIARGPQQSLFNGFNQAQNSSLFQNPLNSFLTNPSLQTLETVTQGQISSFFQHNGYDTNSLIGLLYQASKLMNQKADSATVAMNFTDLLLKQFFVPQNSQNTFASALLTYFGLLKSEEKNFKPQDIDENFRRILKHIFDKNLLPTESKESLVSFLKINSKDVKKNQDQLLACLN